LFRRAAALPGTSRTNTGANTGTNTGANTGAPCALRPCASLADAVQFKGALRYKGRQSSVRRPTRRCAGKHLRREMPNPGEDVDPTALTVDENSMDDDARIEIAGIPLSHPERTIYPEAGLTKRAVAEYFAEIADRTLEETADRPLSLLRLPEGLAGERFFQKHPGPGFPDAVKRMTLTEADGGEGVYMYVDSAAGLVGAVQMGALEFHIQGVRRDRPDRPDRMVFDLDPDEALPFADVASAAADLRDRLAALDLPCWPLVTGGKGVHVVVPLRRIASRDGVRRFARRFAAALAQEAPGRFTASMSKDEREGRIFVDWLRNEQGATAIAPFSLRARPGAPVAVPVGWDELAGLGSAQAFGPDAARERGWEGVARPAPVGLSEARVAALEDWAGRPGAEG
jgi:bifunctional non-homologous end joining protein LigD